MELYGATCVASPSTLTESGRKVLAQDPDSPGTLAIAISEAVRMPCSEMIPITPWAVF